METCFNRAKAGRYLALNVFARSICLVPSPGLFFSDFAGGGGSLIKGLGGVRVWFEGVVPTLGISFLSPK
jgi:hypothetical protein